jgi:hypothetical protein
MEEGKKREQGNGGRYTPAGRMRPAEVMEDCGTSSLLRELHLHSPSIMYFFYKTEVK